jgi:hypothetical protein
MTVGAAGMQRHDPHDSGSNAGAATASDLPGLFILGRCCLIWAQDFQYFASIASAANPGFMRPDDLFAAERALPPVQQWLQASSFQQQLAVSGYAPQLQTLLQQLQQVMTAPQDLRESVASRQCEPSYHLEAAQQLQSAVSILCLFATPCVCNSPYCANLSGFSEVGLVSGRSCVCGGCRVARYCRRACQRSAWKQHKPVCAALAAAAAPVAPAPGAAVSP